MPNDETVALVEFGVPFEETASLLEWVAIEETVSLLEWVAIEETASLIE